VLKRLKSPLSVCLEQQEGKSASHFSLENRFKIRVELHSSRREEAERQTRDFSISLIKPETQKSPHPKKGLSVNPEL
jgi:hypothetical protein